MNLTSKFLICGAVASFASLSGVAADSTSSTGMELTQQQHSKKAHPLRNRKPAKKAKYIFYFIGDGMGFGGVTAAQDYIQYVRKEKEPLLMLRFPVAAQVRTFSANSPVTDSSAGGTALSTGSKANNYTVGINANGEPVYSISTDFLKAGYEVGITTNVTIDDATPSAFYAHSSQRSDYTSIMNQAIGTGIKFYGGSKFRGLEKSPELTPEFNKKMKKDGYRFVTGIEEFKSLPSFNGKTVMYAKNPYGHNSGYTIDSLANHTTVADFTTACLATLEANLKVDNAPGFFMMVEAGNIDWAAHASDGGAVIKEIINMQEGIQIAYRFYEQHPDETLIVVTADHETGGMSVGRMDNKTNINLQYADYQRISKDNFEDFCRDNYGPGSSRNWDDMKKALSEKLGFWSGVPISDKETEKLKEMFNKTFVDRNTDDTETLYKNFNSFAVVVFDIFNKHLGTGFTTSAHTGSFVPLYAIGAGSELFTGNLNNIEVPMLILKAAGLERK